MNESTSRLTDYNWSRDLLKLVAIIAMTADHVSTYLMEHGTIAYEICQFFGNFTIVIMSYFIVQGLKFTHSVRRYAIRMLIWAVFSQLPYHLLRQDSGLNVLVTLLGSLIAVHLLDKNGWGYCILAFVVFLPISLFSDWAFLPLIFTMIFYEADKHDMKWLPIVLFPVVMFATRLLISSASIARYISEAGAFTIITTVIYMFRDMTERKAKRGIPGLVFYSYYPIHLLIIFFSQEHFNKSISLNEIV